MSTNKQKYCPICGITKSIDAFYSKDGKIGSICSQCLGNGGEDGDEGGGGLQVDIVDKLAAIALEQEQTKTEASENFDAVTDRLDQQTERSHDQDRQKKYNSGLFTDKAAGENSANAGRNLDKRQITETIHSNTDTASENGKRESQHEDKTTQATNARQSTLFSNHEQKQSNNDSLQSVSAEPAGNQKKTSAIDKVAVAATRSALFAIIPPADVLRNASANPSATTSQQTTNSQTETNKLDTLATRFIENILRGPGRK